MVKKLLAIVMMALALAGCMVGGGGDSGADGPTAGFDPVFQGPTTLQLSPGQLGNLLSTGGNMPGVGG